MTAPENEFASIQADSLRAAVVPSRRRPRRDDVVTYRVRVDLKDTSPPLWRRLEVASDVMLDEVHTIVQTAFCWLDSHLHEFAVGPEFYSRESEHYLCPFQVAEGEPGVSEEKVRLDEVLVDPGDKLIYLYDFGDGWEHVIELEAVTPREGGQPRATCTDGRRPTPAEDSGGVWGYEMAAAATDPRHPGHLAARTEFVRMYGDDVDPAGWAPNRFDIDEVNTSLLAILGNDGFTPASDLPEPLAKLVTAVRYSDVRDELRRLVRLALDAEVNGPDEETAARMVRPYRWLLHRIGEDGIDLTSAGYLPPPIVEQAMAKLGWDEKWIGAMNRENQTAPVWNLRVSSQKAGLIRKHRGRLLLTKRGHTLRDDPIGLWWGLAERMPLSSRDLIETQAGLILLVLAAAEAGPRDRMLEFLGAMGWVRSDHTPLISIDAAYATADTVEVLDQLGVYGDGDLFRGRDEIPSPGLEFARAALRTWPAIGR